MIREQVEHQHTLEQEARAWYGKAAGEINETYRWLRELRLQEHHAAFDQCRDELVQARAERPRDEAHVADLQKRLDELKRRPLPDYTDLETERQAALKRLDSILAPQLRLIRDKGRRGELRTDTVWSEAQQRFLIPEPVSSEASHVA